MTDPRILTILGDYRQARARLETLAEDFTGIEARFEREALALGTPPAMSSPSSELGPSTLTIRCLGPFEIAHNGSRLGLRLGGKPVAIVKFLVTRGGRPTPRELLLEALWPDADADVAANRLRSALHELRQMLDDTAPDLVVYADNHYLLAPDSHVSIDADEFERQWQQGRRAESERRYREAIQAYTEAERLYGGDYLEDDLYEDWTLVHREYLRDAYLNLLYRLAHLSLEQGDDGASMILCRKMLRLDRCNEEAYRLMMSSHAKRGQRARALRWFEVCEQIVRAELDIEPSPETIALRDQLLASNP